MENISKKYDNATGVLNHLRNHRLWATFIVTAAVGASPLIGCQSQPPLSTFDGSVNSVGSNNSDSNGGSGTAGESGTKAAATNDAKSGAKSGTQSGPQGQSWNQQMRNLGTDLSDLLPVAFDAEAFRDKANEPMIREKLRALDENAKAIQHSPMQTIVDPSVNFLSYDFHDQVKRVRESFAEGKKDYARYELISTSHFCIECHTRNATGPAFGAEKFNSGLMKLNPLDRAEYFTATRHFDNALDIYLDFFKGGLPKGNTALQSEKAALQALVITVRYQGDAQKAAKLTDAVQKSAHTPYYLKLAASAWDADIQAWIKENAAKKKGAKFDLKAPKSWIEKSQTRRFEKGALGGEVLALRSISSLNSALPTIQGKELRAEAFYLLGQSYLASVFSEHTNVGEKYLESCIRTFPKTPWAKKCYQKYEEVVYSNYTGSAGTFMPADEEIRLQDLYKLVE